ncbi:MAG: F0F1 ATP synthase subunit gamma [Bacilli bacterium]|nr:F0F1 ATP synthase subunit gamma [Bacilli bacterium]
MRIKNVVKVMNFHSLLRVDKSKKQAESYRNVGEEITKIIKTIVYNKNLVLDKKVITPDPKMQKLNIYIANDYGFCGNFNSQIARQIRKDKEDYKIIIGSKIVYKDDKTILKINKDNFYKEFDKIEETIEEAIRNSTYSEINLYYNHYNSSTSFEFRKLTLFPIEFDGEYDTKNDFVIETDITSMLYSLLTFYILYELRMCECISRAAENVLRNQITSEAIDKIEELEIDKKNEERREKKSKLVRKTVENFKKITSREEENG